MSGIVAFGRKSRLMKKFFKNLVTGFLIFVAISLLLNAKLERLKATGVMYYGDF